MDTQLKKGLLELCVLATLRDQDSYGYKIMTDILPYIELSESTLYPILKRLELSSYVTTYTQEYNGRLRKYYQITKNGLEKIKEAKIDYQQIQKIYQFILGGNYGKK